MKPEGELPPSLDGTAHSALIDECVVARKMGRAIRTGIPMLVAQMDLMLRFTGTE